MAETKKQYTARLAKERASKKMDEALGEIALEELEKVDPNFLSLLQEVAKKRLDGIERYGKETYHDLGSKGVFVDVNRKHVRLKRYFWDKEKISSEKIEDSMLDNAVYVILLFKSYLKEEREIKNE